MNLCSLCVLIQIFDFSLSDDDMNEISTKCDCNLRVLTMRQYVTVTSYREETFAPPPDICPLVTLRVQLGRGRPSVQLLGSCFFV